MLYQGERQLGHAEVAAYDRDHVWHPYASIPAGVPPLVVRGASGTRLTVETPAGDRELVDGMSSWWAAIHGYGHPVLVDAVAEQPRAMSHVMFGGLTHGPAVELARRLVDLTPAGLDKVFFSDSGLGGRRGRPEDGAAVLALAGPPREAPAAHVAGRLPRRHALRDVGVRPRGRHARAVVATSSPRQVFAGVPPAGVDDAGGRGLRRRAELTVAAPRPELAAVVVEPVVQGAGGMRFHNPGYLRVLREACDEQGVLLVFDEVATGFGRTGAMFAVRARRRHARRHVRGQGADRRR